MARNVLALAMGMSLLASLSGYNAVVFYTALRLPDSADPAFIGASTFSMCVSAASLAGCIACVALVDLVGRRPLLAASAAACTVSMGGVGYVFLAAARCEDRVDTCGLGWWLVVGQLSWAFAHGLGLLSLPTTLAVEMAPTNMRGIVASAGTACAILGSILATVALEMTSAHEACWLYACSSALCLLLALVAVPETKGTTLPAVQRLLAERYGSCAAAAPSPVPNHGGLGLGDVPLVRHNGRPLPKQPSKTAASASASDAEP